jgi:hypothetical protein
MSYGLVSNVWTHSNFWGVNLADHDEEVKKDMQALMTLLTSDVRKNRTV